MLRRLFMQSLASMPLLGTFIPKDSPPLGGHPVSMFTWGIAIQPGETNTFWLPLEDAAIQSLEAHADENDPLDAVSFYVGGVKIHSLKVNDRWSASDRYDEIVCMGAPRKLRVSNEGKQWVTVYVTGRYLSNRKESTYVSLSPRG